MDYYAVDHPTLEEKGRGLLANHAIVDCKQNRKMTSTQLKLKFCVLKPVFLGSILSIKSEKIKNGLFSFFFDFLKIGITLSHHKTCMFLLP